MQKRSNLIDVGRIAGVFGVKGWLKVNSHTEPKSNIVNYSPWWLKTRHGVKAFEVDDYKVRENGVVVVHFKGIDDRDLAASLNLVNIAVERDQMPELGVGEYYWHQLVGLQVVSQFDGKVIQLGFVKRMLETGANDVLVVAPDADSIDEKERLVPYIPEVYVMSVDVESGKIYVDWDPEF